VTGRAAMVRAVLGTDRHGDIIVVTGRSAYPLAMHQRWEPDQPAVCCDLLAAEVAGDGGGRCDIADVITGRACWRPAVARAWLAGVLRRYPGCAVAAARAGRGLCLVGDRYGNVMSIAVSGPGCTPGRCAVACGSFVHGWLCAGWPLAALNPQLRVAASRAWAGWGGLAQGPVVSCSLTVSGPVPAL
jgi:hypothetical protein